VIATLADQPVTSAEARAVIQRRLDPDRIHRPCYHRGPHAVACRITWDDALTVTITDDETGETKTKIKDVTVRVTAHRRAGHWTLTAP
jgi:hypothetical protein